jgi:hypothetical protein
MSGDMKRHNLPVQTDAGSIHVTTPSVLTATAEIFGLSRLIAIGMIVFVCLVMILAVFYFVWSAPPHTITITSGPDGSIFQTNACKYASILARHGVNLKILTSHGSLENLQRLSDSSFPVDIGFVQGGETNSASGNLVSLGSVAYQPLLVFYRGAPVELLSALRGKRLAIGPVGSGTRTLTLTLLAANGIEPDHSTTLLDWEPQQSSKALLEGTIDAVFLMGESASTSTMRELLRAPDVHLFSFAEAEAYTRRIGYLSDLRLPRGSIDLGNDIPAHDVNLIGPTVELIARKNLHPALSDLLLEAAREVHGRATLLQRKGEFPAPVEQDFPISADAARFYKSGKSFLYRYLPFWLASLTSRIVIVLVPTIVVLFPVLRSIPFVYRWRIRLLIYRWYRALLALERRLLTESESGKRQQLLARLDEIEQKVNKMKVPAPYADQFYGLRGHIDFVRQRFGQQAAPLRPGTGN